ncbi:MAG: proton-conducting transporter membrane subunit, partial [Alphaproteobacteria bacterium]
MIGEWPILTIVTFVPLFGALFLLLIRGDDETVARNSRHVTIWVTGFTFLLSLALLIGFDPTDNSYQFVEQAQWLPGTGIGYHMGVDGISLPFVLLSTFLTPLAVLASWKAIKVRVREYMIAFLVLETMMVGMFVSLDMLMFYLFFEAVLIPMFIIIGVWGGARRVYAAFKFFLYT